MKEIEGKAEERGAGLDLSELPDPSCELEEKLQGMGLIPLEAIVEDIEVDLKYSSTDNFVQKDLYGELERCYVLPEVAEKLKLAQLMLKSRFPSYRFIVYDGVRPHRVQKEMWESWDAPAEKKRKYLASPDQHSMHNYGAAVDLSILDEYDEPLDMGTPYDHFGEKAYPSKEDELMEEGELTEEQVKNRRLLRDLMEKAGFSGIPTEWWHFSVGTKRGVKRRHDLIE